MQCDSKTHEKDLVKRQKIYPLLTSHQ